MLLVGDQVLGELGGVLDRGADDRGAAQGAPGPIPLHRVTPEDVSQRFKRHIELPQIQGLLDLLGLANEVRHQKRRADLKDATGGRKPDTTKRDWLLSRPVGAIKAEALSHLGWEQFRSVGQNLIDSAAKGLPISEAGRIVGLAFEQHTDSLA